MFFPNYAVKMVDCQTRENQSKRVRLEIGILNREAATTIKCCLSPAGARLLPWGCTFHELLKSLRLGPELASTIQTFQRH